MGRSVASNWLSVDFRKSWRAGKAYFLLDLSFIAYYGDGCLRLILSIQVDLKGIGSKAQEELTKEN